MFAYVGNMTKEAEKAGISFFEVDDATGAMSFQQFVPQAKPSYLVTIPSRNRVYAASHAWEINGQPGGAIYAYEADRESGVLREINHQMLPLTHAAFVRPDVTESFLLVACTAGGGVAVLPIENSGAVGEPTSVHKHPGTAAVPLGESKAPAVSPPDRNMPHSIAVDPTNQLVAAADLRANRLILYRFDSKLGTLEPLKSDVEFPAGSGPRHMVFLNGNRLAVLNELNSTVTTLSYDVAQGTMSILDSTSTVPDGVEEDENKTAEIIRSEDGRFVYASNRGHDSVAIFEVRDTTPYLRLLGTQPTGGKAPRNVALAPGGRMLFASNQRSNSVNSFHVDTQSGRLTPTGLSAEVVEPTCVGFL